MTKTHIYLDNHATTKVRSEVLNEMLPYFTERFGNASSSTHQFGWQAKKAIEEARKNVASLINADQNEIIFTSGATESNNLVIKGICDLSSDKIHIISSSIEHDCILEALNSRKDRCEFTLLPVNEEGIIDLEALKNLIRSNTTLVSVMFANNEIGSIQPIKEISEICQAGNLIFHTDAAQALGKVAIDVRELGIDLLSASAHKFGGPKGVGFLYINGDKKINLTTQMSGGHQENGHRSGTLNVSGIVGLGKAAEIVKKDFSKEFWHLFDLRNLMFDGLIKADVDISLNGPLINEDRDRVEKDTKNKSAEAISKTLKRLPHNLHVSTGKIQASDLFSRVKHIAMSSGSACSSNVATTSHVLKAIHLADDKVKSSVRIGIGYHNTRDEISQAIHDITSVLKNF